jgi:4'-phosphopantetheinyl transferase
MNMADTVCVWLSSTQSVRRAIGHEALDAAERRRAEAISHPGERERFVAARALLRHAMADAIRGAVPEPEWRFAAANRGKPVVAEGLPCIPFSISHAEDCVAVAVGGPVALGIDVEGLWREPGSEVVRSVLTEREMRGFCALDSDRQWARFIRLWTVKEACAKALGDGVAIDFAGIEVGLDPLAASLEGNNEARFRLFGHETCIAGRDYHAATAILCGSSTNIQFRPISLED